MENPRFFHVYFGDGKGKTTSCIGLAIRAAGAGNRVWMVQFDKGFDGKNEHYSERKILRGIPEIRLDPTGCERMRGDGTFRFGVEEADLAEAARGLDIAREAVASEGYGLVILDEVLSAQQYGLLKESDLLGVLDTWERGRSCELVFSGRTELQSVLERADLVTEMSKVKHYFDRGFTARRGIEF